MKGELKTSPIDQVSFRRIGFIFALSPYEITEAPRGDPGAIMPRRHDALKLQLILRFGTLCFK